MSKRRMVGWTPLVLENTDAPVETTPRAPKQTTAEPAASQVTAVRNGNTASVSGRLVAPSGPLQDPNVPRRRMAGWQPVTVANTAVPAASTALNGTTSPAEVAEPAQPAAGSEPAAAVAESPAPAQATPSGPNQDADVPRRRMAGWAPLKVGPPGSVAPAAEQTPTAETPPAAAAEPTPAPVAEQAPAAPRRRMGTAPAPPAAAAEPKVKTPDMVTPEPAKTAASQSAAAQQAASTKAEPKGEMSKATKVVLTLLGVAVLAAVVVLVAQWVRSLAPVAQFIATYDGTPTHPDGVEAGIPGWVGWQHFFNFFIMVMVIRSGLLIRNQERPEAYWTPNDGGVFSPNKKNTPQKVSIQQWIHQSFNVLWVANGLIFYIMVFATGHWMRLVPTNWDIFPNIVSAGIQYMSLDWPAENSWVYYNALQIMTYFITVFIAAPVAVLTGLRLSTWWPQKADGINKAFPLPVARTIHFYTMVYFILFIIVHLFLVFTTGVLTNLNMMFTARHADDWIGIGVFALSVAVTVGIAWLIKPIFISPIAEKTGTVSTR